MDDNDRSLSILESLNCPFKAVDLRENVFETVKWLCEPYNERPVKIDADKSQKLNEIFECLPRVCNNKELLIALLEEVNCFNGHEKFLALIGPIQKCLISIQTNYASIVQSFDTLCAHLESVPLPEGRMVCVETLEEDKRYSGMIRVAEVFLNHFEYFIDSVLQRLKEDPSNASARKTSEEFSNILLRVFARPLAYLQLDCDVGSCEMLCLSLFEKVQVDVIKFLLRTLESRDRQRSSRTLGRERAACDLEDEDEADSIDSVHWDVEVGCGVLCYLIFRDAYSGNLIPQVYTKVHLFYVLAPVINRLIRDEHSDMLVVDKGCSLMLDCLKRIGKHGFEPSSFDSVPLKTLVEGLMGVVSLCRVRSIIQKCIQCMNSLLWAFGARDRLTFLSFVMRNSSSSSIQGFAVTAIKNQLLEVGTEAFDPNAVNGLLRYVFTLERPKIEKSPASPSGLLDHMDRLMSTLNFLIYLVIKESNKVASDEFGYAAVVSHAMDNFVEPLKREIETHRFRYVTEMEVLRRGGESGDAEDTSRTMNVTNDDDFDVGMPMGREQKEEVLKKFLVDLDLLESSVARVETLRQKPGEGVMDSKLPSNFRAPSTAFDPVRERIRVNTRVVPFE